MSQTRTAPMTIHVELLDEQDRPIGPGRPIAEIAAPFLDAGPGRDWRQADLPYLWLLPYPGDDNAVAVGERWIGYRSEAVGYCQVQIQVLGQPRYRHPHGVGEVLAPGIRAWLQALGPEAARVTGYRLVGGGIERLASQSTPIPKGVAEITPYAEGERPRFRIRPIAPPEPPLARLADLGARTPPPGFFASPLHTPAVKLVLQPGVAAELERDRVFSDQAEEGGFLVGRCYRDADAPDTHILVLHAAVPAEQVGASFLHFTFTGDSFDRIKQRLAADGQPGQPGQPAPQLLGWYHTHLFPATEQIGLSSIDYRLHFTTFRIPWQVAGLLNLDGDHRVLRFYVRSGDAMRQCHHQTAATEAPP